MNAPLPILTIATRASPLALAQAKWVQAELATVLGIAKAESDSRLPLLPLTTTGDKNLSGSLATLGGKGLFTKEIEQALLDGRADLAVHSMKDMPVVMPDGLKLGAIPKRENPADTFLSPKADNLDDLHQGAIIGTASVRRAAQALHRRHDLKSVTLRGNVGTRLKRLDEGVADAMFLAEAGLKRLGLNQVQRTVLNPKQWLPALGQGALFIQITERSEKAVELVEKLNCRESSLCQAVERGFLAALDGSCRTPIAGLATMHDNNIHFNAEILSLNGQTRIATEDTVPVPSDGDHQSRFDALIKTGDAIAQSLLSNHHDAITAILRDAAAASTR